MRTKPAGDRDRPRPSSGPRSRTGTARARPGRAAGKREAGADGRASGHNTLVPALPAHGRRLPPLSIVRAAPTGRRRRPSARGRTPPPRRRGAAGGAGGGGRLPAARAEPPAPGAGRLRDRPGRAPPSARVASGGGPRCPAVARIGAGGAGGAHFLRRGVDPPWRRRSRGAARRGDPGGRRGHRRGSPAPARHGRGARRARPRAGAGRLVCAAPCRDGGRLAGNGVVGAGHRGRRRLRGGRGAVAAGAAPVGGGARPGVRCAGRRDRRASAAGPAAALAAMALAPAVAGARLTVPVGRAVLDGLVAASAGALLASGGTLLAAEWRSWALLAAVAVLGAAVVGLGRALPRSLARGVALAAGATLAVGVVGSLGPLLRALVAPLGWTADPWTARLTSGAAEAAARFAPAESGIDGLSPAIVVLLACAGAAGLAAARLRGRGLIAP